MSIFNYETLNSLREVLNGMLKVNNAATALPLTQEEFIAAFIDPEHVEKLVEVQRLVGAVSAANTFGFPVHFQPEVTTLVPVPEVARMTVTCWINNGLPILPPRYVSGGLQSSCPPELFARINDWVKMRFGQVIACAITSSSLSALNETCSNAKALSMMAPAVTTLLARIPDPEAGARSSEFKRAEAKRAKAMAIHSSKTLGEMPAVPRAVRTMVYEASRYVNSMVLAEGAPPVQTPRHGALLVCDHVELTGALDNLFSENMMGYKVSL